ncbi:uncharacterized protein PV09_09650 [Verruconis gallopava]|uniref:Heterokaryon incompatibility domain-containing protein n=1 Tax=Verruconis gallopava TaxID=253628 RepID=A0A0D1ZX17_9PEZI|nr:uncharacterized protein PV09_09650 [Verruconis gallopava]KIV98554.1 hypothetical protein PV09_09650 [Verruconis gallopava]
MRLLKASSVGSFKLVYFPDDSTPPYAILSHTWSEGQEVTYSDLMAGTGRKKTGFAKIRFCADRAAYDGFAYYWIDTCCINKSDSAELQTAVNSMFRYYQRAKKCYVYLSDVQVPEEVADPQAFRILWEDSFRRSRWFTRGWTLQELLAPPIVEFFSKNAKLLGSKISLEREIHDITKLPIEVLRGQRKFSTFSIEERLEWVAPRTTTLKEDKVYCLLGIFGVFLPLIYGEGEEHAKYRLREEIAKRQERRGLEHLQDLTVALPLPFPRNEQFVGREEELRILEHFLLPNTHQRLTVYGLGGCGKSALVLEFAYRTLARHPGYLIFWVPAISKETFELAYLEIGTLLNMPGLGDDNADIKRLVKETLSLNKRNWLMIVDNADDTEILMSGKTRLLDYIPYDSGKIIFTSRSRKAATVLAPAKTLELQDMGGLEARQLFERRISKRALLTDGRAVDELLEKLAYHALAIVQAAAFINSNETSVTAYILLMRDTEIGAFGESFEDPGRYREMDSTIAKTWYISFNQI